MRIAVVSGKGGAGKTTVAANLAVSLGSRVRLADCDVEEPNLHLFFDVQTEEEETVTIPVPFIAEDVCTGCETCVYNCRYHALAMVGRRVMVFEHLCRGCGGCVLICPENAVLERRRAIGTVIRAAGNGTALVYGRLNIGEIQAPTLIREVKKRVPDDGTVIMDGPPGASCSLVHTLIGSDYAVVVAENSPFGFHDARKVVEALGETGIPFGAIINKYDEKEDSLEDFFREKGIPVLLRIPLDEDIARLSSEGIPFVRELTEYETRFQECFETISQAVKISGGTV